MSDFPKYFYSEQENRALKLESEKVLKYVQIKMYGNNNISHAKGRKYITDSFQLFLEKWGTVECDEKKYLQVLMDYHSQERQDAELLRKYLNKTK